MSFIDLFYPGNPKRREDLLRTHQKILDCLENNFRYTNTLSDVVNEYCGSKLQHIEMSEDRTFSEICELFMARLREIQAILVKIDQKLKEKLHPEDYKKLRDAEEYSGDVFERARQIMPMVDGVLLTLGSLVVVVRSIPVLARLLPRFAIFTARISTTVWAGVALGVVILGVDAIISAIMGAVERDRLMQALEEHNELLDHIKLASDKFMDAVYEIKFSLKHCKK